MKLILVNQRYGHTRTIVIRGWMKGFLSLCLMGAPVALGYLGYELAFADAGSSSLVSQESALASDEFIPGKHKVALAGQDAELPAADLQSGQALFEVTDSDLAEQASYYLSDFKALTTQLSSPLQILRVEIIAAHLFRQHGSFQHGRLVDPASYVRRTLH